MQIDFVENVGQHAMTAHHPHYSNIYNYCKDVWFNFVNYQQEINPRWQTYAGELTESAKSLGATDDDISYFFNNLHPGNKRYTARSTLALIPTLPYFGPENHFVNLEDWSSYFTFLLKGHTCNIDITQQGYLKVVKAHMLRPNFKGILSHMKNTVETFKFLFPEISHKFVYLPLGIPHFAQKPKLCYGDFIFTNSYGGEVSNFFVRGGEEVVNAFIRYKDDNLGELTIVGPTPYISHPAIKLYPNHLSDMDFGCMLDKSFCILIPSAHIHTISMVRAMANGIVPIVSDGWGYSEFITDGQNGYVAKGHDGYTTWLDSNNIFRENYDNKPRGLADSILDKMVQSCKWPELSLNCINYARQHFSIEKRNKILVDFIKDNI